VNDDLLQVTTKPIRNSPVFSIKVSNNDGCSVTKSVHIKIYKKLAMPNAFTPINDGKNDIFRIPQDVTFALREFAVFDRWGKKYFLQRIFRKDGVGINMTMVFLCILCFN
jgi:hypothetical protein